MDERRQMASGKNKPYCQLHKPECRHVKQNTGANIGKNKTEVRNDSLYRIAEIEKLNDADIFKGDRTGAWIEFPTITGAKNFYNALLTVVPEMLPCDFTFCPECPS